VESAVPPSCQTGLHHLPVVERLTNRPLSPDILQTDFELGVIRVLGLEFPGATLKGYFFHFSQAVWRNTQERGLSVLYREDHFVQQWIRRSAGLALLPENQVQDIWIEAMDGAPIVQRSIEFNDYMVTKWVDDDARFPVPLGNHHQTISPRTNNNLEGFHHRLNLSLPHRHPNLFRFIDITKRMEKTEKIKLVQIDFGAAPPQRKRAYKELETRLARLKDHLATGMKTPLEYLDAVGKIIKMD